MGALSLWHWIVVLTVVLILFGSGKLPTALGDMAKGIKAFRNGLKDGSTPDRATPDGEERI